MKYRVRLSKKAAWQLLRLPRAKQVSWLVLIDRLGYEPNPPERKKLDFFGDDSLYFVPKSSCECGPDCKLFFSIDNHLVKVAFLTEHGGADRSVPNSDWHDVIEIAEHLFLGAPEKIADRVESILVDRSKDGERLYQRWLLSHLPAYLLGPARRFFPGRETVLTACLDGVEGASRKIAKAPDVSYDDLWICLEVLEEIAGQIIHLPNSRDIFAQRYVRMCAGSAGTILPAAFAWGVNELLERGPASTFLGLDIARRLLQDGPEEARNVILNMSTGRRELRDALAVHREFTAAQPSHTESLFDQLSDAQTRLVTKLNATYTVSFISDIEPVLSMVLEACANHTGSDRGIACLMAMKNLLKEICATLDECEDENTIADLCAFILNVANQEQSELPVFLVIEASEAVRDAFPAIFARTTGRFLERASPLLAQGIAVCVSEGYESATEEDRDFHPRFFDQNTFLRGSAGGVRSQRPPKGLEFFFHEARSTMTKRPELVPLGHWVDQRLDLLVAQSPT